MPIKENVLKTVSEEVSEDGKFKTIWRVVVYEFDKGKTQPRLEEVKMVLNPKGDWFFKKGNRFSITLDKWKKIDSLYPEIKEIMEP